MKELIFKNKTGLLIAILIIVISALYFGLNKSEKGITPLGINFSISGKIEGAANQRIYVEAPSERGIIPVADTLISDSGNFYLEGNIPGVGYYILRVGENEQNVIPVTLVPEDKLKINCSIADFIFKPNASGTKWSAAMNDYLLLMNQFQKDQAFLSTLQTTETIEQIKNKYDKLKNQIESITQTKMLNDPSNAYNIIMSESLLPNSSFDNWDTNNLKIFEVVAQSFETSYPESSAAETFRNQISQIQEAYKKYSESKNGSVEAPEINLNKPSGEELKLSSLLGKFVLIDFWASWCAPCRTENPKLVKLYKKYQNKQFTILSVSLDEDINAWKNAINTDGLLWSNHVSDLKGWESTMPTLYGFNAIPHTVLVNKLGKIIGVNLNNEEIEKIINNTFN